MARAIDVSLLGLQRALRKILQVLIRAIVLSTGQRSRECARLADRCLTVRSLPGFLRCGTAAMSPTP